MLPIQEVTKLSNLLSFLNYEHANKTFDLYFRWRAQVGVWSIKLKIIILLSILLLTWDLIITNWVSISVSISIKALTSRSNIWFTSLTIIMIIDRIRYRTVRTLGRKKHHWMALYSCWFFWLVGFIITMFIIGEQVW